MTAPSSPFIDARDLKAWLSDTSEVAVIDVREHGQYGENHLFFAVSIPYSSLETKAVRLIPRTNTRVVLYGDANAAELVERARAVFTRLGYNNVHILQGGIQAWQDAGYTVFAGVNLPSKTFGEMVEHVYNTPRISAQDIRRKMESGAQNFVVLDGRTVDEYRTMNIPGSYPCPNGELALRAQSFVQDEHTEIIVNCAGRTRSIIGAQTLINLGIPNPVYALENGTQGWYLEDFPLEHGASRNYPQAIDSESLSTRRGLAQRLAARFHLQTTTSSEVIAWMESANTTVFLCDIRTAEEHAADALPALIRHTPGGQIIQATDKYVGVRKAKLVLCDFDQIRAPVVASWLKQLGWEVLLLPTPLELLKSPRFQALATDYDTRTDFRPNLPHTRVLPTPELADWIRAHPQAHILDARPSTAYRSLCLTSSKWTNRVTLPLDAEFARNAPCLLLGSTIAQASLLARDLEEQGHSALFIGTPDRDWFETCGLPTDTTGNGLPDQACIDFLFFTHDRHHGNKAAARQYLAWETNLLSQIDEQERTTFSPGI